MKIINRNLVQNQQILPYQKRKSDKKTNIEHQQELFNYSRISFGAIAGVKKKKTDIEAEKIIRLICIKNDKNYKKQNLRLGVITIDLSDIKDENGNSLYKEVLEKAKEVYKNELCNI